MKAFAFFFTVAVFLSSGLVEDPSLRAESRRVESVVQPSPVEPEKPFARIILTLEGCGSCASCRADIRQTVKSRSKTKEVSVLFGGETVEISYPTPRKLPLREIARGLGSSRNPLYSVAQMVLETEGEIVEKEGEFYFVLSQTGQTFRLEIGEENPQVRGKESQFRATVKGLKEGGKIVLVPQEGHSTEEGSREEGW